MLKRIPQCGVVALFEVAFYRVGTVVTISKHLSVDIIENQISCRDFPLDHLVEVGVRHHVMHQFLYAFIIALEHLASYI